MNQVFLFFKLIEVVLGCLCMSYHIHGSLYLPEPIPHVLIYCATFLSFTMMAALGAFRLVLTRSSVLSTQMLLTLSAVIMHYVCAFLVMRTALQDPHLAGFNSSIAYLSHPHFAYCKQQSIAALITGTMYLMHMFHVFDLLIRLEPGDWRQHAVGRLPTRSDLKAGRAGLYVLSKPVDDFLCRSCRCYFNLAHSQALRFQIRETEQSEVVHRLWQFFKDFRRKFFTLANAESDESFMSTPSITTSESDELAAVRSSYDMEDEGRAKRPRGSPAWRGPSDSSSLWAQIEDRSTLNLARTRSSQGSDGAGRPSVMDPKARRSPSVWDDIENKEKSEILLVDQKPSYSQLVRSSELPRSSRENVTKTSEEDEAPLEPRKSKRDSSVHFEAHENSTARERTSISKLKSESESPRSDTEGNKGDKSGEGESQEESKEKK